MGAPFIQRSTPPKERVNRMDRLTDQNPYWIEDEFWTSAEEPDDEQIDAVYLRLKEY